MTLQPGKARMFDLIDQMESRWPDMKRYSLLWFVRFDLYIACPDEPRWNLNEGYLYRLKVAIFYRWLGQKVLWWFPPIKIRMWPHWWQFWYWRLQFSDFGNPPTFTNLYMDKEYFWWFLLTPWECLKAIWKGCCCYRYYRETDWTCPYHGDVHRD